uniref:RRM domain-containing protein n=1 Tax=Ananas comosus var. bracteatus TaxID=296719 RepID=A0A6V7PNV7_ANACO|nr:unnamed protein product [Ananas comosus var. bracteatus]
MAFASKVGNLLKRTVTSNPSLYQAIRCMSSSKLFVGGISYGTDDQSLREAFANYGEVVESRVIIDRESGRSRGFGFVTYTSSEEASAAITAMDGKDLHGRIIRVNYATDRTGGSRGYGGSGGYGTGSGYGGSGSYGGYAGNAGSYGGNGDGGNFGGGYNAGDNYNSGGSSGGNYGGSYNVGDNYNSGGGSGGNYGSGGYDGGNIGGNYGSGGGGNYTSGASTGDNYAASGRGGGDYGATGYGGNSDQYGSSSGVGGQHNSQDDLLEDKFNDDDLDDEPEDYANKRG